MRKEGKTVRYRIGSARYSLILVAVCICLTAGCGQRAVVIGSPYERYDHNRTQNIVIPGGDNGVLSRRVVNETYTPYGTESFPQARYKEGTTGSDVLPVANVVPVFTGVSLPLSALSLPKGRSDRGDVIDFLAAGPYAQTGVEPTELSGDTREAEAVYGPVLDFLGDKDQLTGGRDEIIARMSGLNVEFADSVIDSRYSASSFEDILGFRFEKFWFILYRLPAAASYSRLVIVPVKVRGQDFPGKRP